MDLAERPAFRTGKHPIPVIQTDDDLSAQMLQLSVLLPVFLAVERDLARDQGHPRVHSEDLQEHALIHRSEESLATLASIINATSVVGDAAHLVVCIIGDAARFHNPTFPIERLVQPVSRRIDRPFGILTNFLVSHLSTLYVQEAPPALFFYAKYYKQGLLPSSYCKGSQAWPTTLA